MEQYKENLMALQKLSSLNKCKSILAKKINKEKSQKSGKQYGRKDIR